MKYRLLGNTGLYVSELCLGTMTFGAKGFWEVMGGLQQAEVDLLVRESFNQGINFFDQLPLAYSADSRIATHRSDRIRL